MDAANPIVRDQSATLPGARRLPGPHGGDSEVRAAIPRTKDCTQIVEAIGDSQEMTVVKLDAISRLSANCERPQNLAAIVGDLASGLSSALPVGQWHLGMPAFEMLSKIDPDKARPDHDGRCGHLRRLASSCCGRARSDDAQGRGDADSPRGRQPSERADAGAGGSFRPEKRARTSELALKALDSKDYQLIRQAAARAAGEQGDRRGRSARSSRRSTVSRRKARTRRAIRGWPSSRGSRSSRRWTATGTSPLLQWRDELKKYLSDFDPNVASAAADILGIINGTRPDPTPTRRAPQQPTELELRTLPSARDDVLRGRQPESA